MSLPVEKCDQTLADRYLNDLLSEQEESQLFVHLDSCEHCRNLVAATAADDESWSEAEQFLADQEFDAFSLSGIEQLDQHQASATDLSFLSPTDDPRMLGRLGSYEVSGVIGAGGMGIVLKAFDASLDRVVAIKILSRHLAHRDPARRRFAREAKAVAAVLHPNVIPVHAVAEQDGVPYFVMPYLRGGSLQKRLDNGPAFELVEILRIGQQVAGGLAAAHQQGLVHRDVKPANILLGQGVERVSITDFGLARAVDDAAMTQSGVIVGTPQYMSPEQGRGETIDCRSDLFSLGSVLYAMCTGHPPFRAPSSFAVVQRLVSDTPRPIREINPSIPVWLVRLIERLHAKEPQARIQSAEQLEELLAQCLLHVEQPDKHPVPASLSPVSRHRISLQVLALLVGLTLIGSMAFWPVERPETPPQETPPAKVFESFPTDASPSRESNPKAIPLSDDIDAELAELRKNLERLDRITTSSNERY